MITDWEAGIEFVLKEEGGANGENVAHDHGGYTKFGISTAANPEIDIPNLTRDGAKEIYRKKYWNICKCDELPSPLAIVVFDACVNQGDGAARKMLQIALGVTVDGVFGDETITAAFKAGPSIVRKYLAQRMARYARRIKDKPDQEVFIENWSARLMRCAELVLSPKKEEPT